MNSTRPPFPSVIDSSLIAAWRSCHQKAFREYIEHWKPKTPSVHLHAGGAYAKGLEVARRAYYLDGLPSAEAIPLGLAALMKFYGNFECPPDSAKSLERTAGAYEFYFSQYPLESDKAVPVTLPGGGRGIEFSFAEPIERAHPVTGDPLLYVGRMDMLCEFAGGVFGEDDKTTSQLGASWPKQWDLRSQFTGYCWGAGQAGIKLDGFLVRGVSILKSKYDTLQAITYRPQWMIDRWYEQLLLDIDDMVYAWEAGYWDFNLDHACSEFGGCSFRQICLSEPASQNAWLEVNFERRKWDPVTRTETKLAEAAA